MKDDPTIARIRQVRHKISERFGHDPKMIVEYYINLQKKKGRSFVALSKMKEKVEVIHV